MGKCKNGHSRNSKNLYIDKRGWKVCRACQKANQKRWKSAGGVVSPEAKRRGEMAYKKRLKAKAYSKLGNRCANPNCGWRNVDGSVGCTDIRCLQVDHVHGGGRKERTKPGFYTGKIYLLVLDDEGGKYQLLCANCNWIKRVNGTS